MKLPMLDLGTVFWPKVFCCFSKDEWEKQKNLKKEPWPMCDEYLGLCVTFNNGHCCIIVDPSKHNDQVLIFDTIAHEAYHAAVRVFDGIGDKEPSEEMTALMVGRISGFVMTEYLKRTKDESKANA